MNLICSYLNNNYLTGGIPAQLANLTNLEIWQVLLLSLPPCVRMCVWLIRTLLIIVNHILEYYLSYAYEVLIVDYFGTHSYLSYNKISGAVPTGLANIPKLIYLWVLFQNFYFYIWLVIVKELTLIEMWVWRTYCPFW